MACCARGVCTIMTFLYCYGTPSYRLATGTRLPSTMVESSRSMAYSTTRSTSISCPTPCFPMGAYGLHGPSGMTWMMQWRWLLTWRSLPCACRTCLPLRACHSRCTQSRTALTQTGRHAWMRRAMSFRSTTMVVRHTWRVMPNTYSSCSTTPRSSLWDSGVILVAMPRRSSPCPRRSVVWPRSMVSCASRDLESRLHDKN
jgi:hypothetical protein